MTRPLKPNTIRRIEAGLRMFTGDDPAAFMGNSNHDDDRLYPATRQPLPARTTKTGDWVCSPLMVTSGGNWATRTTDATAEPLRTRTANPNGFEAVVTPEPFLAVLRRNATATSLREPMATVTAGGNHHALIVPYYSTGVARPVGQPLDTVSTRDRFALTTINRPVVTVANCRHRMVKARESLRSQRFSDSYIVTGNQGEQTMQAGNAVSANVAQWLGECLAAALGTPA
jgi:DNA (cytosine-5)-methyltransferase 1